MFKARLGSARYQPYLEEVRAYGFEKRISHFWISNCLSKEKEKKKRRNPGLELSYLLVCNFGMDTCLGFCMESMDLLVRKLS